ncbi:hypothetical protein K432DRAFT_410932 [Lepidopterella palustris CBS 459.81]|uniref:Uncharacterized protein n=1 Tax=Lepidopterella palustris CBS 459.81 TaxID=1314670 RepID=A0A8E2J8F6_9PEZI|nr:hypothetical protein K432DRAFT_410932 [Lepidopterella palustris CBS 459.81]
MPEIPRADHIPGSRAEISEVIAAMGPSVSIETLEYPDVASAMAQLQESNITHSACQGVSGLVDPSKSGLILQTAKMATEESRQDLLSVREVPQAHPAGGDCIPHRLLDRAETGDKTSRRRSPRCQ